MKALDFRRMALCSSVAAAMLAACGGSQPPIGAPGAMPQSRAIAAQAKHGGSWMLPGADGGDLLYVSANTSGEIYVFSYPKGALVGTLTGLTNPAGLCVDRSGDVWAVTVSNSGDSVSIFSNASGSPTTYTASGFYEMYYCGYDNRGNLLADGNSQSGAQLAELAKGGDSLEDITINATLNYPGAVQWDGKYLAVAELSSRNSSKEEIYRVKVNGSGGTVAATVTLLGKHFLADSKVGFKAGDTFSRTSNRIRKVFGSIQKAEKRAKTSQRPARDFFGALQLA